jgi:hypothetical protein
MSATMTRQGGQVQMEQSNMCPALNMAKMAKECGSHTAIEVTKYQIRKPRAWVQEWRKRRAACPGHK